MVKIIVIIITILLKEILIINYSKHERSTFQRKHSPLLSQAVYWLDCARYSRETIVLFHSVSLNLQGRLKFEGDGGNTVLHTSVELEPGSNRCG